MNIIEKIENGVYDLNDFSEQQISFIKALVKIAYNECYSKNIFNMKKKKKTKIKFNPVAKARATGEHGAMRSIIVHKDKSKYSRKLKHKKYENNL